MHLHAQVLKNHVNGCHGNHALFHSAKKIFFEHKNSLHFWGALMNNLELTKNCPWGEGRGGCKVGQISFRGIYTVFNLKLPGSTTIQW